MLTLSSARSCIELTSDAWAWKEKRVRAVLTKELCASVYSTRLRVEYKAVQITALTKHLLHTDLLTGHMATPLLAGPQLSKEFED